MRPLGWGLTHKKLPQLELKLVMPEVEIGFSLFESRFVK